MQPEPNWTSYVAIVTGIIGALTGIAGSIMGYIAYRRSNEIKKSDRHLDVHKLRNAVDSAARRLHELLTEALNSRKLVLHARGLLGSEPERRFKGEHMKDLDRAKELSSQIPPEDTNYDSRSQKQLEQELVRLDRIKIEIDKIRVRYQDSIQQDQRMLEPIRIQRPNIAL